MIPNQYGEIVLDQDDVFNLLMSGHAVEDLCRLTVDQTIDIDKLVSLLPDLENLMTWKYTQDHGSVEQYDQTNQQKWLMPTEYQELDIAAHVLSLCDGTEELQRAGQELLMFQERGLFDLLRWLVYLIDIMKQHRIVWGVGRGSSVASFVLFKLGVHRINSLHYDLDPAQFLR
jgi:DNA polymerase III alpha subunit